jgi:hypothetical protein
VGVGLSPEVSGPEAFEGGFNGLRVDMPHKGSDELNLPAPGAMAPYFMCEFDGRQKLIRQFQGLKLAGRQGDQLFAQALQGPVFIFFPGSAFIFRIHFAGLLLDASDLEPPRLLQGPGLIWAHNS